MKVTYRKNRAGRKKLNQEIQIALIKTAEALKTDIVQSQIMPFDSGHMQNDSMSVETKKLIKGVATIIVDTPYARKVYFDPEITIHQDENSNAKQYYFDDYIKGNKKNLPVKYFKKFVKQRNGG